MFPSVKLYKCSWLYLIANEFKLKLNSLLRTVGTFLFSFDVDKIFLFGTIISKFTSYHLDFHWNFQYHLHALWDISSRVLVEVLTDQVRKEAVRHFIQGTAIRLMSHQLRYCYEYKLTYLHKSSGFHHLWSNL